MERIANRDASSYVRRRQEFKGSNLFGTFHDERYVVYSYGVHWPMFIHDGGQVVRERRQILAFHQHA